MTYFVGLDWAARDYAVCAIDERGAVAARFTVAHSAAGMAELVARLGKLAPPGKLRIAIERPSGLVVNTDLVGQRVGAASQLRNLLGDFWPGAAELFADIDSPIALDFLERYPAPASAASLGEQRMHAFLARHRYSGRRTAAELVARLRAAPDGVAGELEAEAKGEYVRALVAVLRPLVAQLATLTAAAEHAVEAHTDAKVVTPLFRSGRICAAQILAETGDDRGRFSPDHLAAEGGVAPVTHESGKHRAVAFRWACNVRLRAALTMLADTTRHTNPRGTGIYQRTRDRGSEHAHAIRILARAWCRIIWHCWQQRVAYDPAKHRAARQLASTPCIVGKEAA